MTDRERLIELLEGVPVSYELCMRMKGHCPTTEKPCYECLVDYLLDNGVTFAKDIDAPSKWIDVNIKLPALIPCGAGTAYSEAVNILTSRRKVLTAIWDGTDFISDAEFWDAEGEEITHWTPVPLPLPDPPEEQNEEKEIY